ncbi:hypothetical protein BKA67DRAFT_170394 [Truncatella angustata]|uniref:Uncharacterized protein n=1 Tax=Truncatella angustata TaxID=152316 RepID=A0A9P9A023_9PEZI|nr:uncharacterized protein BKA67DRAFT_170394 [Truncatella angustata]KAH6656823.1 hypothetical protein BKA67DRAFT_170394 [Truncatella angustata]
MYFGAPENATGWDRCFLFPRRFCLCFCLCFRFPRPGVHGQLGRGLAFPRVGIYDDGEVTRYGAGESYRPFNDRTPRRGKSPAGPDRESPIAREREPRDRARSPPREPRIRPRSPPREPRFRPRSPLPQRDRPVGRSPPREPRARSPLPQRERPRSPPRAPRARSPLPPRERPRSPPAHEDRYIPDRTPRRRSRSPFRPDRSRDHGRDDDRGGIAAADTWRRQRSRSPIRRSSPPRRSPIRRNSPPPRRFSPVRRDLRDDRDRRGFNQRDPRGRSRSLERDRRDVRDRDRRSPPARRVSPPRGPGASYRRRSPSMDRRDDRYGPAQRRPSPPREPAVASTYPSRDQSRRPSPLPSTARRDDRSNPQSPLSSRHHSRSPQRVPLRDRSPVRTVSRIASKSPPRGPAALRPPPTGPRGDRAPRRDIRDDRDGRDFPRRSISINDAPNRPAPGSGRDAVSPGAPPSGPRGYGSTRGGYGRGGRGNTWIAPSQSRNDSPAPVPGPAPVSNGNSNAPVPTGPRGQTPSSTSIPSTPTAQSKPFNPPKGPAAEKRQLTVFEKEAATMTPIMPGGKMTAEDEAAMSGVLPEQLAHFKAAEEESDRLRKEIEKNEERTRAMMADFRKGQRECELLKLRTDLTEAAVAKSSGESYTGSAF